MLLNTPKTLVLHGVNAYRIPDTQAQINTRFDDGQTVTVRSEHETWLYVESVDGRTGWIQEP
jgi:SH3-like domain-containing protein